MLTTTERDILNNSEPTAQLMQLGTELYLSNAYGISQITKNITTDATGEQAVTIPFACVVLDVIVQARASSGSGTVTLKAGATAITDAIDMVTDTAMTRAGTINDAVSTLAAGATVTVDTNGATDFGLVTIIVKRV